jgi:alginate O-acetyltransferase complex protein AlgF
MKPLLSNRRSTLAGLMMLTVTAFSNLSAQPAGQLYDPEPPADSAYVRVLVVNAESPVDIVVDGKPRSTKQNAGDVSDYMVLPAGKHTIAVHPAAKSNSSVSYVLDVVKGRALTLVFNSTRSTAAPTIFEDKANTNKLKSMVAAYHLDNKVGALDLMTADGSTKVFSNLAFGASNSIQVNPISVELIAAKAGENTSLTVPMKTQLSMAQGATYSVFLMPNANGKLVARTIQNKTERYTGK